MALYRGTRNTALEEEEKRRAQAAQQQQAQQQMQTPKVQTPEIKTQPMQQQEPTAAPADLLERGRKYNQTYIQSGGHRLDTEEVELDLSKYTPDDIAELTFQVKGTEREAVVSQMLAYYKGKGYKVPTYADIQAKWGEWDAQSKSVRAEEERKKSIEQGEAALGEGRGLTKIGTLSAIASMADGGEKDAAVSAYADMTGTIGSKYYNTYANATSQPLKDMGLESVDDAWFAQNAAMELDLLYDEKGRVKKPGNSATQAQKNAYGYYILRENEQQTKQAEEELAALYTAIGEAAKAEEFDAIAWVEGIDWDKYPMLQKMREAEGTGEYPQLNRAVPLSTESLYGAAYCAQKGIEVSDAREYEMYAGAWVNDLKKQSAAGTSEEEPEGIFEKIGDLITGKAGDRQDRIAQGEAAQATLEKLGVPMEFYNVPKGEMKPAGFFIKPRTEEDAIKSFQNGNYSFVENAQDRSALRDIDAQIAMLKEEQATVQGIADTMGSSNRGKQVQAVNWRTADGKTAQQRLAQIREEIGRLNAKKVGIAFEGKPSEDPKSAVLGKRMGDDGMHMGVTPQALEGVKARYEKNVQAAEEEAAAKEAQAFEEKTLSVEERKAKLLEEARAQHDAAMEQAALIEDPEERMRAQMRAQDEMMRRSVEIANEMFDEVTPRESQNMQAPTIGQRSTERKIWYDSATGEIEAMYDEYDAAMAKAKLIEDPEERVSEQTRIQEELDRKAVQMTVRTQVLKGLIPKDEETAAARAGADPQRIEMLCEREVAQALGDTETVAAINEQMAEAGYPMCWPEEEAIVAKEIEIAKGWGDDAVRERLGITDGRKLTDMDYFAAANTGKSFFDWEIWKSTGILFDPEKMEKTQEALRMLGKVAFTNEQPLVPMDAQTTEKTLGGYVEMIIGKDASVAQSEAVKNLMATGGAVGGGVAGGVLEMGQGLYDTIEAFTYEAAKAEYGEGITPEQMVMLSPGYAAVRHAAQMRQSAMDAVTPDLSERGEWAVTLESITKSVTQNAAMAAAGSAVGKIATKFAQKIGIDDVAALQNVYQKASKWTQRAGMSLAGMKSGLREADAAGLEGEDRIAYAIGSSVISAAVEEISLDPIMKSSRVIGMLPDGTAETAAKGFRLWTGIDKGDTANVIEKAWKVLKTGSGEALEEIIEQPAQAGWLMAMKGDTDMPWYGEGGVIDPKAMLEAGAQGFVVGGILGSAGAMADAQAKTVRTDTETNAQTQTQESTSEEKPVENEAEVAQDEVVDTESATATAAGKVKKTPEQIARKAQDYAEIMEAAQDPDAGEDVIAFAQLAAEEVAQKGEMTDETRAQLRGMLGLKRLKTKMIMEDMANMARIIGSEATSAQTKAMAEEALSGMGNDGLDASTRKAVTQAAARDIAKAQAQAKTIEARKELEKATKDEKDIRKEYGQMNGRMVALNDNMSELIAQVIDGKANKEIQGQYQTLLSKTNTLQRRLENQKARMRDAQERKTKAQAAYDAAKAKAKADEEVIYEQIVNAGAKTEPAKNTETQTQPEAVKAQTDPEAELDKATIEALEDGDEEKALGIQKAKEDVKIQVSNPSQYSAMPSNGEAITAQRAPEREPRQAVREVFDRFEDYDVRGFKKYLKDTLIYVNEQQRAEIKNITGLSHNKAGYKYGVRFTNDRSKGSPLDGGTWSDISGYFPGILDEGSSHPVNDLIGVLEDIRKNEQEKRAGGILRYMSLRVRSRTSGDGAGSVPTESGQQIIEKLRKTFPGVTVRARSPIGAIDDRGGYAQVQTGGGRVVGLQNVEDYVHEIGHLLSVKQNGVNEVERSEKGRVEQVRVKQEHVAGVDAMVQKLMQTDPEMLRAYSDAEERRQEAISIFWERWLLGDEAASEFAGDALYEVLTGTADAKQMKALEEARKSYIVLHGATQAQRDEAQIVSERVARERALDAATTQSFVSRSITDVFDENYAAKLIDRVSLESALAGMSDEEIKEKRKQAKKTGSLMMEETDRLYYQQANLSKASGVAKHWVKNKIIGRRGQVLLDTNISETVAPISKEEKTAFGRYVMLLNELDARNLQEKHRQEAAESDTQYVPRANEYYNLAWAEMSKAEIEREIATVEAEHTQFKSVHEGLRKIWTTLMEEYQIAPGYIENAQEAWDAVNAARPHYLPTRVTENSTVREERQTQSIAKEGREIRSASAGERDVVDPVMTMVSELTRMAHQSAAMDVKNTIARVYDEYEGQGRFFREITQAQVDAQRRIFDAIAQRDSFNLTDVDAETAQQIIDEGTNRAERRVIVSIEDGKARYFEVLDQMAYDMLARTETPEEASREMRALAAAWRAVDNTFRATTTLLSPFFGIKNSVRDASTAAVFGTQRNAVELVTNFAKSIVESGKYFFRGELESDALRQFAAMGGLEGDSYSHDVEGERQKLKDVFKEEDGRLRKMMDGVVEALRNFNDTIETGMRFAQFQMGLKAGQSTQRAFRMSQEVTTDFSRTGRKAKKMAKYFFFFNASLQGTYDVINAMQESEFDPQRTARMIQRSIVHAAVMPLALAIARAMMWDDEEKEKYDALAENVKRENHVLGFIGKKAIIIPKGQSLIFTLGDAIGRTWADGITTELRKGNSVGDYFRHEGLKDVGTLAWDLAADVWPFQTSVFQTGIDLMINRNHWGDEITPEYMKLWDARNKYDNYTSSVAVAIGQVTGAFGISPKMIHYAIDQQMGFVGDLILKMTTPSSAYGQSLEESEGIGDFMMQNFVVSPARLLFDMAVKGFTSDIRLVSSVRDDFEEYKDFFEATLSEYDQYDGERDKMRSKISGSLTQKEYTNAYNDAVQMNKYLNKAKQAINNLYKEMKANPDETQACQDAIMQIQMVSNQAAESWQRRYMDGDMSVQVIIPKVKEGNGK